MRKRTQINFSIAKRYIGPPHPQVSASGFRITGAGKATDISLTLQQMRQLFHLGYAFNLRQLKYLEFDASLVIGSVDTGVPSQSRSNYATR